MTGRPTRYKTEYDAEIIEWLAYGKTLASFAETIGVSRVALWGWQENNPSFLNAIKKGREIAYNLHAEQFLIDALRDPTIQQVPFVMYCRNFLRMRTKDDTAPPPPPPDEFNYGEAIADDD